MRDDPFVPGGFARLIKGHPCHTPGRGLVLPSFEGPDRWRASPYLGAPPPARGRDVLLFHRGRMGEADPPGYSRGVRQRLLRLAERGRWRARFNISITGYDDADGDYTEMVARSVFCLVAAGDGWTSRFDDAVLHGCIPVIVMDGVVGPWGHQLRWQAFSVRVREADIERLPEILLAIPPARVRQMQRMIANVWRRFAWLSHPEVYSQVVRAAQDNAGRVRFKKLTAPGRQVDPNDVHCCEDDDDEAEEAEAGAGGGARAAERLHALKPGQWRDDAFHTLLQWLHHKLLERRQSQGQRQRQQGARQRRGGGRVGDGGSGVML